MAEETQPRDQGLTLTRIEPFPHDDKQQLEKGANYGFVLA